MKQTNQISFQHGRFPGLLLAAALILVGCNLPVNSTPTEIPPLAFPSAGPTDLPIIQTPTTILISPTPASITQPTAAPTIAPTAIPSKPTPIPGAIRINFETGATAGVVEGDIQPGQVLNYLVEAAGEQPLMVSTGSPNNDVTFSVRGVKDNQLLLDASLKYSSWQTMLAVTQDYLIQVYAGASAEHFSLNVITPARINFDPGAISAVRSGKTAGGWNVSYVVRASLNQQMDLDLQAPAGNAVLSVYGYQDGQPYLRYVVEQTTFSLKLPATQDYIIQVVPRAGQVVNYTLTITIK